jgi:bifunctional DNA-binding transcriptional regulator/antitoxin component of YhaV-PrlF toxin-antitoxin module
MLTKITIKNQITLPKAVLSQCSPAQYFEVTAEAGRIVLTPVQVTRMDDVWGKLEALGIKEQDISDAVAWART